MVVSNKCFFHPYLGKITILTNIFQMGWNHQPVMEGRAVVCVEIRDEETPGSKADSELGFFNHSSGGTSRFRATWDPFQVAFLLTLQMGVIRSPLEPSTGSPSNPSS